MTEPVFFDSTTSRYALPLLFPGQAQKEFYVNESFSILDILTQASVLGVESSPPGSANEGDSWLIGPNGQGEWTGNEGKVVFFSAGSWNFLTPMQGMRLFNESTGQFMHFDTSWKTPPAPQSPQSGAIIDAEARATIDELINTLRHAGLLPRI